MKKVLKKVIGALIVVALLIGVAAVPEQAADASGKISTKKYDWNLKGDKTVCVGSWFYGWDIGAIDVTLKNYKVINASKKGYKKISFIYEAVPEKSTLSMVKKANGYYDNSNQKILKGKKYIIEYLPWLAVFDYKDGMTLEAKNKHNVTVKSGKWKHSYGKLKKGKGTRYLKKCSIKVEITYPKSYKNMVIATGGFTDGKNYNEFWDGKCSFFKTDMYKHGTNGKGGSTFAAENISLMRVQ